MTKSEEANRDFWNEVTPVHYESYDEHFIGVQSFLEGKCTVDKIQLGEIGDLKGKSLLHLQCHFGLDTLSLARLGAKATGVDFSPDSINKARELSNKSGIEARFIESNIYDLPDKLDEKFDLVYTSQGVLCWLKDINEWGRIVERFLKPGGKFYIMEQHPVIMSTEKITEDNVEVKYTYFGENPPFFEEGGHPDYADWNYNVKSSTYEWSWSLGEIINSLINAGLKIEFLNEYDKFFYCRTDDFIRDEEGWWYLPGLKGKFPLMFTLGASKE